MNGYTIWRVGGGSECNALTHRVTSSSSPCGPSDAFIARPGAGFGTSGPLYSSTLSGTATSRLNGTLVECFGPANNVQPGNRVNGSILQILGQYILVTTLKGVNWSTYFKYFRVLHDQDVQGHNIIVVLKKTAYGQTNLLTSY